VTHDLCSSCGAAIIWTTTKLGRPMPVDAEPTPTGNIVLVDGGGGAPKAIYKRPEEIAALSCERYISHFATCPHADQHRKPKSAAQANRLRGNGTHA
jgi:hypothetical protein